VQRVLVKIRRHIGPVNILECSQVAELNFDTSQVAPGKGSFPSLPAGWYRVEVIDSGRKAASTGSGDFLKLEMVIIEGDLKGRKIFDNLNLWNRSQQACEIAIGDLRSYGEATCVSNPGAIRDSVELHDTPFWLQMKRSKTNGKYADAEGFENSIGNVLSEGAYHKRGAEKPSSNGGEKRPWE
jgi:hypothetical protein